MAASKRLNVTLYGHCLYCFCESQNSCTIQHQPIPLQWVPVTSRFFHKPKGKRSKDTDTIKGNTKRKLVRIPKDSSKNFFFPQESHNRWHKCVASEKGWGGAILKETVCIFNPLNAELNPICHSLILLGDLTFMGPCIVSIFQYISNKIQRYTVYIWKLLYMFRVVLPQIIRSAYNCIYSIWYLSHRYCYLPLSV